MPCFQLLPTLQATFQTKNSVRISTPASIALDLVSYWSHHKSSPTWQWRKESRTKESFVRTTMEALELLQLMKRHVSGWSDVRNQACSYRYNQVTLGQLVNHSVSKKFFQARKFWKLGGRVYGWSEDIFELGFAWPILPRCHKVNINLILG